ncbi:multicopper oxidase [Trichoderma citrinoviride]|uniref:Multicopper oxidase n=1 Tax=Trichoderma citrinoviride TaxID=58853 RepID=A0A2T4B5S0_9HYPO|nr:multicopper oxidase [Trichoderma citrinoviride]PTB64686.1 multicopper oxidase [Trichoderma citrinoviride]
MGAYYSRQRSKRDGSVTSHKLSHKQTNGLSLLGVLTSPFLPDFLNNNPTPNGYPWSNLNCSTNYYDTSPKTGVIRSYEFTVSRGVMAPDGYQRNVLLINGAFPGPLIEANWGDTIQVTLHNNLTGPEEGTALHWHGFLQQGTPWEDGAPAVTQCPVAPGKSFTYQFHASLYGTTWYHSHYSAQYAGGLFGPLVVHGPKSQDYDVDVGPVMLSDWYHEDYFDLVERTMSTEPGASRFPSDNNLINGKMVFDCSQVTDGTPCTSNAGIAKFKFQRGKTHLLRLINAGAAGTQRFSIDGHKLTVIANDFVDVEPYETEVVTLGIGQRSDVLVKADGDLDAYWMRSNISRCSFTNQPNALAAIYYDDTDSETTPESTPWDVPDPGTCINDDLSLTVPVMKLPLPEPDVTIDMELDQFQNDTGHNLWRLDGVSFRGNFNSPTLLLSNLGNLTFEPQWSVRNTGDAKSVRVNLINRSHVPHPMHLHGFNMYILHEGWGEWDGESIVRPSNPQRRDVFMVRAGGYVVMQFDAASNPGVWPFHCHIAWHASAGLFTQFLTAPDEVRRLRIPNVVAETCRQWGGWTNTNIPEQIDSGL